MQKSEATRSAMDVSTSGGCSPSIVLTKSYNDDDDEMMMMICVPCNKWNRSLNLWMVGQIGDVFQTSLHLFVVIIKITHNGERIIVIIIIKIILLPPTENDEQRWFQPLPPEVSPLLGKTAPSVWMKVINIKSDPWGGILVLSSKHPCPPSTSVGVEVLLKFFLVFYRLSSSPYIPFPLSPLLDTSSTQRSLSLPARYIEALGKSSRLIDAEKEGKKPMGTMHYGGD